MNKIILLGRLTKDVELRYTQTSNTPVASFTLAVNRKFTKEGEEKQADFLSIVAWNKLAETASKYLKKGTQILVTGRLQTRTWDDEQGVKHYVSEIIAEEFDFIETVNKNKEPDSSILDGRNTTLPDFSENTSEEFIGDADDLPF